MFCTATLQLFQEKLEAISSQLDPSIVPPLAASRDVLPSILGVAGSQEDVPQEVVAAPRGWLPTWPRFKSSAVPAEPRAPVPEAAARVLVARGATAANLPLTRMAKRQRLEQPQ